jgi:uncharacterized protein (TIGR03437 family)
MLSPRVGQTLVRLIRTSANGERRWQSLALVLAALAAIGAGGISARLGNTSGKAQSPQSLIVAPPASYAHFVTLVKARFLGDISSTPVTTVSAASFEAPVAPESIVAAFGSQLATQTIIASDADPNAPGIQLPTQLGGTTVEVNGRRAGLFFVSPAQVNYAMPAATESGSVNVVIKSSDGTTSNGTVQVAQVAPAIFTANATGTGVPAAVVQRFKTNGQISTEFLYQFNSAVGRYVTKPIDMGQEGERLFLVLFVTGVRRAEDTNGDGNLNDNIRLLIGGNEITPLFAGRQPEFVGLDQINAEIPRSLIGRGIVNVSLTALGFSTSRLVDIEIAGIGGGGAPPQVSGFGSAAALAGQPMVINGSGFSSVPTENLVRIGGLDAEVITATPTTLTVMVPFGVETATVKVQTPMGEGVSASVLPVRTSISGIVENTAHQPLGGVAIKVSGTAIATTTDVEGSFVLPDVPAGPQFVEVDGGTVSTNPPYPKISLKLTAQSNRDNQFARAIALQQSTGASGVVGSGSSLTGEGGGDETALAAQSQPQPVSIQIDDFKLEVPGATKASFPGGATRGTIFLTPLQNARTPVELPFGYYSSSIVQITPFEVKLDPGAKLVFPNKDGFPAGAPALLWRYDQEAGKFVQETVTAAVSADGQRIETAAGAIKVTTYYFAAVLRITTTITGRVLEKDGKTPVIRALARYRGQEAFTDGNGSYVLRYIPVKSAEEVSVDVSVVRPNGRVDRVRSERATAVLGGNTRMPNVIMPGTTENRPPTILAPPKLEVEEGKTTDVPIIVTDPDPQQTVEVKVEGAAFASVVKRGGGAPSNAYFLRLAPNYSHGGNYTLTLTATDSAGANAKEETRLTVKEVNRAPVAGDQAAMVDEDTMATIKVEASDPDGDRLSFVIVSPPANGGLSGNAPNLSYKPNLNFNGVDRFTFKASDGAMESNVATVTITVKPVNDPPVLTAPATQAVNEGQTLSFAVSASDPDVGQKLTITATGLPDGAALTAATPTSAQFRWTPTFAQAGIYTVSIKVADDGAPSLSDTKEVRITVRDVALFTVPSGRTVNEGQELVFDVSANNSLPAPVIITAMDLPAGASFPGVATNTAQFRWTPNFTQAGTYIVRFKGTIGIQSPVSEIKQVAITVLDTQRNLADEAASLTVLGLIDALPPQPGSSTGSSVAMGDLNGDGANDLVIGSPSGPAAAGGGGNGAVHVFFGGAISGGTIDLAKQPANVTINGEAAADLFGSSLAIGDINGDGRGDLIVGAPGADPTTNVPDGGKVYAVFGNLAPGTYDIAKIANLTVQGAARSDRLGASVAVGKIDGNAGADDLIVGAPFCDVPAATAALADAGCVYGFFGDAALAGAKDLAVSSADFKLSGMAANGQLGAALATGYFNEGELTDLAIGAPNADFAALKTPGVVYLVLGSPSLKGSLTAAQASALILNGGESGDAVGAALAMGDINGDGRADLIVGAPGADGPNNARSGSGEVYVIFGSDKVESPPAELTIFGGGANNDEFPDGLGSRVAAGDFTGDGIADLVIGAPGADPISPTRPPTGAAYVIFGLSTLSAGAIDLLAKPADLRIFGAKSGDRLGSGGLIVGNISNFDPGDLAIGVPAASRGGSAVGGAGEVRVLYGVKR